MQSLGNRHHSTLFMRACKVNCWTFTWREVHLHKVLFGLRNPWHLNLTLKLNNRCILSIPEAQRHGIKIPNLAPNLDVRTKTEFSSIQFLRHFSTSRIVFCEKKDSGEDKKENATQMEGELTQRQKLKRAVKEYGPVVIIFHICIALLSLGFFYSLVSLGVDVIGILRKLGVSESLLESQLAAGASTFVIAYAVHKLFAVPRIGITLTCAPMIVRKLRQVGVFKPPKPSAKK